MSDKFYLVEEEELIELIANYYKVMMLERYGVDNWSGYGRSKEDIIKEIFPEATEGDLEDLDFYYCTRAELKNCVLVKKS